MVADAIARGFGFGFGCGIGFLAAGACVTLLLRFAQ